MTVRLDAWKEGQVASTRHEIRVEAPKVKLDLEPLAPELRRTLVHPDRRATIGVLQFSPAGEQAFVAGYPSGIVQIFDVATGKEKRRIEGPSGFRSSAAYAVPSRDWKTVYIAVEIRKSTRTQKNGKTVVAPDYRGEIRVFDVATGVEKAPLKREGNGAVATITLTPDGKRLRTQESFSKLTETGDRTNSTGTFEWDIATGKSQQMPEGHWQPKESKDGRWSAAARVNYQARTVRLAVTEMKSGKEVVLLDEKNVTFGAMDLSPDGRYLAASLYRHDKDASVNELKVWDLGTMKETSVPRMRLDAVGDLKFSPDGKVLGIWMFQGGSRFVDTESWTEHELPGKNAKDTFQRFAFSGDGKRLAVVATRYPEGWERSRDPDPLDFPQPRVYLYDLPAKGAPRVLVCPQGFVTKLDFDPTGRYLAAGASGGVLLFEVGK